MCEIVVKLFLTDNGCPDHYEPAGEYCIRASALKETYSKASEKCVAEGGSLLYVLSQTMNVRHRQSMLSRQQLFYWRKLSFITGCHHWCAVREAEEWFSVSAGWTILDGSRLLKRRRQMVLDKSFPGFQQLDQLAEPSGKHRFIFC